MPAPPPVLCDDARVNSRPLHPWQAVTIGSGLMLHAALALQTDLAPLLADLAALDAAVGPSGRLFLTTDGSWGSIALVERAHDASGGASRSGDATPALAHAPNVRGLLSSTDWTVLSCYLIRQPPHGTLPWHFDNQAIHLAECRLLIPLLAPRDAVTWIGHEAVAYCAGTAWAGDFSFPHQVENPTDAPRVVLAIDVLTAPAVRRLLPSDLAHWTSQRQELGSLSRNLLLKWRAQQPRPGRDGHA